MQKVIISQPCLASVVVASRLFTTEPPGKPSFRYMEKEMATRSSNLAWRIPWTEKPCGLQSMRLQRVRQDLATKLPGLFLKKKKGGGGGMYCIRKNSIKNGYTFK